MTLRRLVLVGLLAMSLVALRFRSRVQSWLYDVPAADTRLYGKAAPELPKSVATLDGAPMQLSDYAGRVVLLHFWTFDCGNCQHMTPYLNAWHERFESKGLTVLGVHTPELDHERDVSRLRAHVTAKKIRWRTAIDPDYAIWDRYHVHAWPTMILVDRQGRIRATFVGDDRSDDIEAELNRLLAEYPSPR